MTFDAKKMFLDIVRQVFFFLPQGKKFVCHEKNEIKNLAALFF